MQAEAPPDAYCPVLQSRHEDPPLLGAYCPLLHDRHEDAPLLGAYCPLPHARQSLEVLLPPALRYRPDPHEMHAPCPLPDWYCPSGQALHVLQKWVESAATSMYVPGWQEMHPVWP
jgi:hypothetical protein